MSKRTCLAFVLCVLAACTQPAADADEAEQAVPQFHMALSDNDFQGIYQRASAELKQQYTQQQFVAYLEQVRQQLGEVQGTERTATKVEGRVVTLTYKSAYAKGSAIEEFTIRTEKKDAPVLMRYRLLEPALPQKGTTK